jgi:hypothetical protein
MQTAFAIRTRSCAEGSVRFLCLLAGGAVGGLIIAFLASAIAGGCMGITFAIINQAAHRVITFGLVSGLWFSICSVPTGWIGGAAAAIGLALLPTNVSRMLLHSIVGVLVLVGCMLIPLTMIRVLLQDGPFHYPEITFGKIAQTLFYAGTGVLWPLTPHGRRFADWVMPTRGHYIWIYRNFIARPHRSNS